MALECTVQHVMCYSDQHEFVVVDPESSRVVQDVRDLVDAGGAVCENCDWAWLCQGSLDGCRFSSVNCVEG